MISLSEFANMYLEKDTLYPYQEALMEKIEFENGNGSELKIFDRKSGKERVFDYFYTHWNLKNETHMIGQKCEGEDCPICQAVEAIADTEFIKEREMRI